MAGKVGIWELVAKGDFPTIIRLAGTNSQGTTDTLALVRLLDTPSALKMYEWLPERGPKSEVNPLVKMSLVDALMTADRWMEVDVIHERGMTIDAETSKYLLWIILQGYDRFKRSGISDPKFMSNLKRRMRWFCSRGFLKETDIPAELLQWKQDGV